MKILTKIASAFFWLSVLALLLVAFDILSFGPRGVAFLAAVGLIAMFGLIVGMVINTLLDPPELRDYVLKRQQT